MAENVFKIENIVDQVVTPTPVPGISDIKQDWKTAALNSYLDSSTYAGQHSIASTASELLDGVVSYVTLGKYDFETAGGFKIPVDGTYSITLSSFIGGFGAASSGVVIIRMYRYDKGNNIVSVIPIPIPREACDGDGGTGVYSQTFTEGESILFYALNKTDITLTVSITATIIKLS